MLVTTFADGGPRSSSDSRGRSSCALLNYACVPAAAYQYYASYPALPDGEPQVCAYAYGGGQLGRTLPLSGHIQTPVDRLQLNPQAKPFVPPNANVGPAGMPVITPHSLLPNRMDQENMAPVEDTGRLAKADGSKAGLRKRSAVQKQLEGNVRRTVYICDIDQQVTEEQLAAVFQDCGHIVDCRVCGDPNSAMRFAFIEFFEETAVRNAITKNGSVLGQFPLRVLPSKTAIVPVKTEYLPRTSAERELCARTVYAANIDKKVDKNDVCLFFESLCGPVAKIRLLGDYHHLTRIAFVEFCKAESAKAALNCSGALLGSLPVRVSPSKTPVRVEAPGAEEPAQTS